MILDSRINGVACNSSFRCIQLLTLTIGISAIISITSLSPVFAYSTPGCILDVRCGEVVNSGEGGMGNAFGDTATIDTTVTESEGAADTLGSGKPPRILLNLEDGGRIVIQLMPEEAPKTVERIISLADEGFYDGVEFHRVESYLVQAGWKECDVPPLEGEMFSQYLRHEEGMVGMARLPSDYNSATNQFYICKKSLPSLNGEYTLFGKVTEGMDIVHQLEEGRKIQHAEIIR
jgi:cyclophilin family peptidyl-prolyl cis-trans isomerase